MKKNKHNNAGFSLVELLVTVAILAALAAVLVPSFISVQNDTWRKQDENKFQAMCVAFKTALSEPEVMKYIEEEYDNTNVSIVFQIKEDGEIIFNDGILYNDNTENNLETTTLWLNAYQSIGITYEVSYTDFRNQYVVFHMTPKTEHTTAKCTYEITESSPI